MPWNRLFFEPTLGTKTFPYRNVRVSSESPSVCFSITSVVSHHRGGAGPAPGGSFGLWSLLIPVEKKKKEVTYRRLAEQRWRRDCVLDCVYGHSRGPWCRGIWSLAQGKPSLHMDSLVCMRPCKHSLMSSGASCVSVSSTTVPEGVPG